MKQKNFIPKKGENKVKLEKKIDELLRKQEQFGKTIDAISKSHDIHITMISNFARHDLKNSIHSIDSIVSTNEADEITTDMLDSIKLNLNLMRETISNFSKFAPHSDTGEFELNQLINSVKLLTRQKLYDNKITLIVEDKANLNINFKLPFQSILQMLNNLVINSIKAFDGISVNEKMIKLEIDSTDKSIILRVYDNGEKINESIRNKIFQFGVSSTGGSGVGLFHAKYLCDLYKSSIKCETDLKNTTFTKYFEIELPILKE